MDGLHCAIRSGTVGRLLEDPPAVFRSGTSVATAIDVLRETIRKRMVTYLFVVDPANRLIGVVAFRELLYAERSQTLDPVMLRSPFFLLPETTLVQAMREVVTRHYPVYPVCEEDGTLVGQVRGQTLFEQQAFEISAQAGSMVGVEKEERLATPLMRSFKFRHPWLQINLLTVFVSAAVVGMFQGTIDKIVVLAMFLPVLGGQSGNLGCQSLAVLLRGMTLGELRGMKIVALIAKEAAAGIAERFGHRRPGRRGDVHRRRPTSGERIAVLSGLDHHGRDGLQLHGRRYRPARPSHWCCRRLGADPATASSIFLTTITDVVSMGTFLVLVTWLVYLRRLLHCNVRRPRVRAGWARDSEWRERRRPQWPPGTAGFLLRGRVPAPPCQNPAMSPEVTGLQTTGSKRAYCDWHPRRHRRCRGDARAPGTSDPGQRFRARHPGAAAGTARATRCAGDAAA